MQIRNINGLTVAELHNELIAGGRFVTYQYCVSALFLTFRPSSDVYFVPSGKSSFWQSLPYTLTALLLGWWGLPWGPVHTVGAVLTNLRGGTDVTELAMEVLISRQPVSRLIQGLQLSAAA